MSSSTRLAAADPGRRSTIRSGRISAAVLALAFAGLTAPAALAETAGEGPELELIMSDPLWIGETPQDAYWSIDGRQVYYERERRDEDGRDLLRLDLETGESKLIEGAAWAEVDGDDATWNSDRTAALFERAGDLFVRDVASGELRQLTRTAAAESRAFFLRGDDQVAFLRDGQYFVRDLASGLEWQPADVQAADDPDDEEPGEDYLSRQQPRLLEVIAERQDRREKSRERRRQRLEGDPTAPPRPFYLGDDVEISGQLLSPRADGVAVVTAPADRDEGREDQMPEFVTEDGYVNVREVRAKVGTAGQWSHAVTLLDPVAHERHDVDLSKLPGLDEDPLAELRAAAEKRAAEEKAAREGDPEGEEDEKSEPRAVRVHNLAWSPDGAKVAFHVHSYDNKDRWLVTVEKGDTEPTVVERLTNPAWINWYFNEFGWLEDGRLWFLSEQSGYSQLYLHDPSSGETRRLTEGEMVVQGVVPGPGERYFYYVANDRHPGRYDVHRVAVESGESARLTSLPAGNLDFELSPSGEQLLVRHSTTTRPPELFVQKAEPGAEARRLTETVSERFASIDWNAPEIVEVPSSHQERPIYSRFYASRNPERLRDEDGRVPAVIFIHGAGYLQNSHMGWSGYFREFMFHTLLTEHGYHVLDMDYRASAGYGADWRTAIYRHMGQPELEDLEDGVAWLIDQHGVDPRRVGTYGGSYGGFLTMMALFKKPELFAAGAALRPVTDWAHYNHPYTANILNTPDVDPEAYERSSPIEFAEGLDKPLLICAPMLDDNVFFQDTVRLAQKLIELGKDNWEVAIFPVEPHGFRRPSSWLDEYRRIFELFEEHLSLPGS